MYKKKKNKHTRRMIVITVVLIVTSVYALVSGITELPFSSVFQDTIANAEYYVIKAPVNYVKMYLLNIMILSLFIVRIRN